MGKFRRFIAGIIIVSLLIVLSASFGLSGTALPVSDMSEQALGRSTGQFDRITQVKPDSEGGPDGLQVSASITVNPTLSRAVRDLPPAELQPHLDREINPRFSLHNGDSDLRLEGGPDPLLDLQANAPSPSDTRFAQTEINLDGQGFTAVNPPDTVGEVGPEHFIQIVNSGDGALVQIYGKDGSEMTTPFYLDSLGSDGCDQGFGDGIVLYDDLADRWVLTEFSSSAYNKLCFYISKTADPLGEYYAYAFDSALSFPDYPKYGVWSDAYYATANESSPVVYAFDRTKMLAGEPATSQSVSLPSVSGFSFQTATPVDFDGSVMPPERAGGLIMRHRDTEATGNCDDTANQDCLEMWEFNVDFVTPANSVLNKLPDVPITEFDSDLCGLTAFACFQQPGTLTTLDPLREVIMHRLQYRNDVGRPTIVGTMVTDATGDDRGGKRWFVIEQGESGWAIVDEGTYAPNDGVNRFMGSIAMDSAGNIALAYNTTSDAVYPSLRYTGRLQSDPPGTMPQGEYLIIDGASGNGSNRYGDYSAMSVDPVDGCTFWFTGQYNEESTWSTRIASFRFDACGFPDFTVGANPAEIELCAGDTVDFEITVGSVMSFTEEVTLSTDALGATFALNPVAPPTMTIMTIADLEPGEYTYTITGTSGVTNTHADTVALTVQVGTPTLVETVSPANGATGQIITPLLVWEGADDAILYDVQIATDTEFAELVLDESALDDTSFQLTNALAPVTTYYWRVRSTNACGENEWSDVAKFETSFIIESRPNIAIGPNEGSVVTDTISLEQDPEAILLDLHVQLGIEHTYVGDLQVKLRHDNTGTEIMLVDRPGVPASMFGCSLNNIFGTATDDGEVTDIETYCDGLDWLGEGDTFMPTEPLATFANEPFDGDWTITVIDNANGDAGTLLRWSLIPTIDSSGQTAVDLQSVTAVAADQTALWLVTGLTVLMLVSIGALALRKRS